MNRTQSVLLVAFALFSLFFGAGNLILPPYLGLNSGGSWSLVAIGFCISAVLIPILGILAHARLQGTMFDFAKKVSPVFSLVYCYLVYAISISLPSPRTAAVTHEMGILPFFGSSSLLTSLVYFTLVFVFVINRSKILNIIGKILTPAIIILLIAIICTAIFSLDFTFSPSTMKNPFSSGLLEGYQTFDAIGAVVVGGVIIISINLKDKKAGYDQKRKLIANAGWLAGLGLALIYIGLIITGALMGDDFSNDISRTLLLSGISKLTLGNFANLFLSVLVSLACFTTAVGIITGTADFIKGRYNDSKKAYLITAFIGCFLGVLMGQLKADHIIVIALPALMFIYPITIILILLNLLPERFATQKVFRFTVIACLVFSVPDFMATLGFEDMVKSLFYWVPLINFHLGWLLPSLFVFLITALFQPKEKA